jgi:hypothetical protein
MGRKLAIHHQFYKWDQALPTADQTWNVSAGRIPFVSWKPARQNGTTITWPSISGGAQDAWITAQADRIREFGHPLFMVFNHEPFDQSQNGWGTPSDFVAAWRHIVDIFRARGATNVSWVLVLTGYDYKVAGRADAFYPGNGYVDWIAADPYNFFTRDGVWRELSEVSEHFYTWGSAKAKPLMLAEWGCEEDPSVPGRRAQWFQNAGSWLKARPNIKAVVYYNNKQIYDWSIDLSASSLTAFSALGADPWFNPGVSTTTTTAAPTTTTTTAPPPTTTTTTAPPPTTTTTTSPPPQTTTVVLGPVADARVEKANPNRNFGSMATLLGDRSPQVESLLRFNVGSLTGSVTRARLRVWVTNKSKNGPEVYPTATAWTESGVTWNTRPARTGPLAADAGAVAAGRYLDYDVTRLVTGTGAHSFVLAADSSDGTDFNSREASGNRPQLVLELAG